MSSNHASFTFILILSGASATWRAVRLFHIQSSLPTSQNPPNARHEKATIPFAPGSRHGSSAFCAQSTTEPAVSGSGMGAAKLPPHHRQVSFASFRALGTLKANSHTATAGTQDTFKNLSTQRISGTIFRSCRICDVLRTRKMSISWLWTQEIALKVGIILGSFLHPASCDLQTFLSFRQRPVGRIRSDGELHKEILPPG